MKFNWKILVALVVLVSGFLWGVQSLRTRSYSGTDVTFSIGSGPVTVTNLSAQSVPVQLAGTGSRSFSITNSSNDLSGTSVREGNGGNSTQLLDFDLPVGVSEFSIARGRDVMFIATADEPLEASVQPLSAAESQATLIAVVVIMSGAISYIAYTNRKFWINRLRHPDFHDQDTQPMVAMKTTKQTPDIQSYGDNRSATKT